MTEHVALSALLSDDCQVIPVDRVSLPPGDDGTYTTLDHMRRLILTGMRHPVVRRHAELAVAARDPGDLDGQLDDLRTYLRSRVIYRRDPESVEYITTPWWILRCGVEQGLRPGLDCDDLTVLYLALAGSIGFPTMLRVVSSRPDGAFDHVLGVVECRGAWREQDLTLLWSRRRHGRRTRQEDIEVV